MSMVRPLQQESRWAHNEFGEADFGDQRLTARLIKLADSLAECPESSINQACGSWTEAKAAYRFFQNDNIEQGKILAAHVEKTVSRAQHYETVLAIQDTCYISYTSHKKTKGLGLICSRPGFRNTHIGADGVIMHTSFAVTTQGLPLGLLDQKIHARTPVSESIKAIKKKSHHNGLAIQDKESLRWLESLQRSHSAWGASGTQLVTVCDREADMYDFFEYAHQLQAPVLVRACKDRTVNKTSLHSKKSHDKLWSLIQQLPIEGTLHVELPNRDNRPARLATLELRFGSFTMVPPRNNIRNKTEDLPALKLQAIYVIERHPPEGETPLEWMLLTNLPIDNKDEALEKIHWYCMRWRIEVFHKILKSGLLVEECRLGTAERLIRYLTVMSIIAWRLFFITLVSRTDPTLPCTALLAEEEWKVLYAKRYPHRPYPATPPPLKDAIRWIAQLGGFLARKGDGEPGPMALWRGWKRLIDLSEGWMLARA
jgi:hypothetical protein